MQKLIVSDIQGIHHKSQQRFSKQPY